MLYFFSWFASTVSKLKSRVTTPFHPRLLCHEFRPAANWSVFHSLVSRALLIHFFAIRMLFNNDSHPGLVACEGHDDTETKMDAEFNEV